MNSTREPAATVVCDGVSTPAAEITSCFGCSGGEGAGGALLPLPHAVTAAATMKAPNARAIRTSLEPESGRHRERPVLRVAVVGLVGIHVAHAERVSRVEHE